MSRAAYVALHARPTIGPGQRFRSKVGFILPVVDGHPDTSAAEWIAPWRQTSRTAAAITFHRCVVSV
jgi:hypothetical protein